MKMIDHNHFICHLILGTFTEYPYKKSENLYKFSEKVTTFFQKIAHVRTNTRRRIIEKSPQPFRRAFSKAVI